MEFNIITGKPFYGLYAVLAPVARAIVDGPPVIPGLSPGESYGVNEVDAAIEAGFARKAPLKAGSFDPPFSCVSYNY
ncbi:hypothetical protein TRIP_C20366 [Candidatus Zixiibacteriota bacterium]|nr:hypothetical protein TRIP_C20366 [candidate division Zixibacteria bacterium]